MLVLEMLLLLVSSVFAGCENSAPPPTDLSKTPWLDPQAQMKGLKNSDCRVRGLAAHHLGNMGARAAEAIPVLEKLARDDPDEIVRESAAAALEKIRAASD